MEDFDLDSCLHPQHNLVLLIRPLGNFPQAEFDLTPQQCEVLSQWVGKERGNTTTVTVGPLQQIPCFSHQPQTASSALCLPGNLWSCFTGQDWPKLTTLDMRNQVCSLACAQGFVKCRFPALQKIYWCEGGSSATVFAVICQACLPCLADLFLSDQSLSAAAFSELLQACWPCLDSLYLYKTTTWIFWL